MLLGYWYGGFPKYYASVISLVKFRVDFIKKKNYSVNAYKERDKLFGREFTFFSLCNRIYLARVSPLPLQKQECNMSAIRGHTKVFLVMTLMPGCQGRFYSCSISERQEQTLGFFFFYYEFPTSKFLCSRVMPTGRTQMKIRVHQTWRS